MADDVQKPKETMRLGLTEDWVGRNLLMPAIRTPLVPVVAVGFMVVFWFVGGLIDYPFDERFQPSLLWQPMGVAKVLVVAVTLVVLTLIGTAILGRLRYDAGWAVATVGLVGLRLRAGDSTFALLQEKSSIFLWLSIELLLLGLLVLAGWQALHILRERGSQRPWIKRLLELPTPQARLADRKASADGRPQQLLATGASVLVMGLVVLLLCRSEDRVQTMASVGIGAWAGAFLVQGFLVPTRPAIWFLISPIICGVLGYAVAMVMTSPEQLASGEVGGPLAALARPMPLDWIAAGLPMTLLAYVMQRTKQLNEVIEQQSDADVETEAATPS